MINRARLPENVGLLQSPDLQLAAGFSPFQRAGKARMMRLNLLLGSERRISVAMGLVFLPWISVVFYTAGWLAALNFLGYALVVFAIGYGLISMALPAAARTEIVLLAPALGILAVSALTAFWLRLGLPLIWAPGFWLGLIVAGALCLWRDRSSWTNIKITYGFALAFLSVIICAVCFFPSASNDMVQRRDGSFNWKFIDSQQFYSIAESIKDGSSPPKTPGTVTAELLYHFAPYTPAATISRIEGLDLGDAVARVTRGASLWALILSCFALGMEMSLKATGTKCGAILSVAGLFLYGPLLLLIPFNGPRFTSGLIGSLLSRTANEHLIGAGVPYDHFLGGQSILHGLVAITAIMGICLTKQARETALTWRGGTLLALPALAVPFNSLASVYCISIVAILLFWGRLREMRSWLLIALMLCLFFAAWKMMGYGHSGDAHLSFNRYASAQWWMLLTWFLTSLGIRILGFRWISQPLKEPLTVLVLTSVIGWLAMWLSLNMVDSAQTYGLYFLQSMFSIFAFSRIPSGWWHRSERLQLALDWLGLAKKGMMLLVVCGLLIGLGAYIAHTKTGVSYFRPKLILAFSLLVFLAFVSAVLRRDGSLARLGSAALLCALMAGFLAWSPDWVKVGMGWTHTDVTYPPEEVYGLRRLGQLMVPGEIFATNKHDVAMNDFGRGRSYGYSALSGRPVLLEGYFSRGENMLPWFSDLFHDNELLFSTTDPDAVRNIARKWHVRFLVARAGTDIALPRPLPPWLIEQQNTGDLKIYRIN